MGFDIVLDFCERSLENSVNIKTMRKALKRENRMIAVCSVYSLLTAICLCNTIVTYDNEIRKQKQKLEQLSGEVEKLKCQKGE